ncbi:MAG: tetratricopeptide repeat protein [Endomicrobium sp.]|jgi:tetratricopeptide (TPR) repeat protein|nr:tetratricopeptide repeat protein [Endomicrobium sp.]
MQEDNSYKKSIIENLSKQIESINQEIQQLATSHAAKLQQYIYSFKEELDLISKENEEIIVEKESQDSPANIISVANSDVSLQENANQNSSSNSNTSSISNQNDILKDIRAKLKNLDDIIKKAKESKNENETKAQGDISQKSSSNEVENQDSISQNISEPSCDISTQEPTASNEEKSEVDKNTIVKKEDDTVTIGKFDELIRAEPTNFKHYMERANLYLKKNNYDKAELDYKKAQELTQSKDISVLLALANLYNLNNSSKKALSLYDQALEINPSDIDVLQQRATCYLNLQKEEEFLEDIEKAISLDENNVKNYAIRAEYNASKGHYSKALDDVNKVIKLRPDNVSAKYFRGVIYYNLEKYNECYDDMKQTIEFKIDENEVYKYIGICSFKLNKLEAAKEYLVKAVDIGIRDESVFYYKAQIEYEVGNFDASFTDVSKVIDMNPKEYKYYLLRARVCDKKGFFDQADKDYEKAYKLESTLDILIEKADFLIKHEKYKQALKDYTLAISLDGTKANFYKQRSYIYEKLGKSSKAKDDLDKALSINPSNESQEKVAAQAQQAQVLPTLEATSVEETSVLVSQEEQKPVQNSDVKPASSLMSVEKSEPALNSEQISQKQTIDQQQIETKKEAVIEENIKDQEHSPTPVSGLSADVLFNRANINYKNQKFDTALKDIETIILQDQKYVKAYNLRAEIYHRLQDVDKELQDLNKSIELANSLFLPYLKRAEIYVLQNKEDLAFSDFAKAVELNPKNGDGYIGLARIYAKRGQKDKALENYNNAKKYDLKSAKIVDQEIQALS